MQIHTDESDEAVVRRVQAGDGEAFGVIIDRYEEKLKRYGRRFLSGREDIEDVVQDVLVSAYRSIHSFDTSLRFSSWIYRIAHNAFVNTLRSRKYRVFDIDFDTLISHHVVEDSESIERDRKELAELMEHALARVSPKYREVLVLHYFEDMSYKDIADVLQVPVGTVGVRIKRAKEALRAQVKPQDVEGMKAPL
jgi:RNA polymerase sigma-70 factor, ECF subfamily